MENQNLKPVIVKEIKPTSNPDILNVYVEQEKSEGPGSSLAIRLMGIINSNNKKNCYTSLSQQFIDTYGIVEGSALPEEFELEIVSFEFQEGDTIPQELRSYFQNREKFSPKYTNADGSIGTQNPKTAGKDGEILTRNGRPIYRNNLLMAKGDRKEPILVAHDNKIGGSNATTSKLGEGIKNAVKGKLEQLDEKLNNSI